MNDELYHFKYTRKYKGKSGKWIYVYGDRDTRRTANSLNRQYRRELRSYDRAAKRSRRIAFNAAKADYRLGKLGIKSNFSASNRVQTAVASKRIAQQKVDTALKKLEKFGLKSQEVKRAEQIGRAAVS